MRRARGFSVWIAVAVFGIADASAQQTDREQSPVGSVKGHVICSDTQRPARFAEVILLRKLEAESEAGVSDTGSTTVEFRWKDKVLLANGRSLLDGSYEIRDVPPGDYYVLARLAGYIGPISNVAAEDDIEDLDKVLAGAPLVHVVADRSSTADLTLRRGGTIKGTAQFEDGTPLRGGLVKVEAMTGVDPSGSTYALGTLGHRLDDGTTDDEGNYRISGLPPGKYRLRVDVEIVGNQRLIQYGAGPNQYGQSTKGSVGAYVSVYPPGTLRKSKAAVFEIKGNEQVSGADVRVDLNGLHSVRGRVLDSENKGAIISGVAGIFDENDKEFQRRADLRPDGTFQIEYVPEGTYTVLVHGFALRKEGGVLKKAELPVIVMDHDVDVDEIQLKPIGGNANH